MKSGIETAQQIIELNTQVVELHDHGRFEEALPLACEAEAQARRQPGQYRLELASSLVNLGGVLVELGMYADAGAAYLEALEIHRASPALMVWQLAMALNNFGMLKETVADYPAAEQLFREAHDLLDKYLQPNDPDRTIPLNNLGRLLQAIGDYSGAERILQETLDVRERLKAPPLQLARSLNNLAELFRLTSRYQQALPLYERALQLLRDVDPGGDDLPATLNNLGTLHRILRQTKRALSYHKEAVRTWTDRRGMDDPLTVSALSNLALVQERLEDLDGAEAGFRRALEVRRHKFGNRHPDVANSLFNLGLLRMRRGAAEEALDLLTEATLIEDGLLGQVIAMGSERQVMAHLATLRRTCDAYLSLVFLLLPRSRTAVREAFRLVLRRKAIGVEALTAQRSVALVSDGPVRQRVSDLRALRDQIARATLAGPGNDAGDSAARLSALQVERESIEAELARLVPELNFARRLGSVEPAAIAQSLPEGATLVEFFRFDQLNTRPPKARYVAFVLRSNSAHVRMVDVGEAARIDRLVRAFRSSITGENEGLDPFPDSGQALSKALLTPLTRRSGRRLIVAADGELTRLPFSPLPSRHQRVLDLYDVSYVSCSRDLLRGPVTATAATAGLVIADPDFDLGAEKHRHAQPTEDRRSRAWRRGAAFTPLQATRAEGRAVARRLGVEPLLGRKATEGRVKASVGARVLHLATHGFFFPDQEIQRVLTSGDPGRLVLLESGRIENPLLRAGLALAGANTWDRGLELPVEAEDGILTAEDVAGLDLRGTELVVLSACDTGLGMVRFGEGVLGLRRAFAVAGARTLVMSLWKVRDRETQRLMASFYRRLLQGLDRWAALREAQVELRRTHPDPLFWGAFICEGDPGPLPPVSAGAAQ